MADSYLFTSESVSEGHPDKVSDQISDNILDAILEQDPNARVAAETLCNTGLVLLAGEITTTADVDYIRITRNTLKKIGYDNTDFGIDYKGTSVLVAYDKQSGDIAQGVDKDTTEASADQGAGDQGLMFGYACNETDALMPAPIYYSHKILKELAKIRHNDKNSILLPDSKSQITLEYNDGKPVGASSIVVSTQHKKNCSQDDIREIVREIINKVLPEGWMCPEDEFYVNPTGIFEIGGPDGDAGLTGRKIIVDTYGGASPHGGGAFSGKDPTKVDRSAAYLTRYLAKNVVAAGLASKCTIQIAYAIGISKPLSLYVNTAGTGRIEDYKIEKVLTNLVDMSPRGIREHLKLNKPIYVPTSAYGHFGRVPDESVDGSFSWEKSDLVDNILRDI